MSKLLLVLLACTGLILSGCGRFNKEGDETQDWSVQKLYAKAHSEMTGKDYADAIDLYRTLIARFPYGRYAEQSQLELAFSYYKEEEPEKALATASRFIRFHPTHANADYAYYLKGLVNFKHNDSLWERVTGGKDLSDRDPKAAREALAAFRELATRFPESRYASDSKQRIDYLLNNLARHDIHVARYYMNRKAYVAVVNRSKYVIEKYQETPAVEDALGLMAMAYVEMGLDDLARDTRRIIKINFPRSPYLERLASVVPTGG